MTFVCGCGQNSNKQQNTSNSSNLTDLDSLGNDSSEYKLEFRTLSNEDQWLQVDPSIQKSDIVKRLVDAYNASVVQNSIITDFDLQMRGLNHDVTKAIKSIDVTKVKDAEVLNKLKAFKKEILNLLSVSPDSVNPALLNPWKTKDDLHAYLSEKYNVSTFGEFDKELYSEECNQCASVPEWKELMEKRGNDKMIDELKKKYNNAKDFDARCIYAMELSHAYMADTGSWIEDNELNPAIPIMESLMKEKRYSLYLCELWRKWRALYQDAKGMSKDSEIPNWIYNHYRNICCSTILSYIADHPQDMNAINEFLVLACMENILQHGVFEYGNQYVVEMQYLYPEIYEGE